jgi:unsaturated rhamnogalacturonyl hydrolase
MATANRLRVLARLLPIPFLLFGTILCATAQQSYAPQRTSLGATMHAVGAIRGSEEQTQPQEPLQATDPVLQRALAQWPAGRVDTMKHPGEWGYEEGVLLDGIAAEWRATGDVRLFRYIQAAVDRSVDADGVIHLDNGAPYPEQAHTLDDIEMGRSVLLLYQVLQQPRYYKAAKFLHDQMQQQPKTVEGGYWHKQIYPNQMWADGSYMAEPFLEDYAVEFAHPAESDAVAAQMLLLDEKLRDRTSGLLRHGYDASRSQVWANRVTGQSAELWSRGIGWYTMAAVDVLARMPVSDPQRAALMAVTRRILTSVVKLQDEQTGLWWQVIDKPGQPGNYFESSASCMFVYSLAKAVRLGVMPPSYEVNVTRGWEGIQRRFVEPGGVLTSTVKAAGLGGKPYRSGSYAYYVGEPTQSNDAKGVGAYLLALSEITARRNAGDLLRRSMGHMVLLDHWFNDHLRTTADGNQEPYLYTWNDEADTGFSAWGHMFRQYGLRTDLLDHAPTADDLRGVSVYIIAAPENGTGKPNPHWMDKASAEAIDAWVRAGGVLVVLENDALHADQTHFDLLTDRFGLHFNADLRHRVHDGNYSDAILDVPAGAGGIFHHPHRVLLSETCSLAVGGTARTVLAGSDGAVMAVAHVGRGVVFAAVDPWLYNQYTDGRDTPSNEDNFAAGQELTHWLVGEASLH